MSLLSPGTFGESERASRVKRFVSTFLWRFQKSSTIINLFFFTFSIGGIYLRFFPDAATQRPLFLTFLYVMAFFSILSVGWLYDHFFRLWREDAAVEVMRDQFQGDSFTEKEKILLEVDLVQNKTIYEALRTNLLICDYYGISYGALDNQAQLLGTHMGVLEEWIEHGRINRPL